jgi:HlyD family secretion protein
LIARDLRRMQVWASVNEADIGRLKIGMPVNFSVDAFPDDLFRGEVFQIRLNAAMTSNVVVYTVVITVDNSDLKLLPYLTANVKFEIERRDDVLLVPNAALRYQPRAELIEPGAKGNNDDSSPNESTGSAGKKKNFGILWQVRPDTALLYSTKVEIGSSDGTSTEIISDIIKQGDQVVTGEAQKEATGGEVNNPFAPPKFRGNKKAPTSK